MDRRDLLRLAAAAAGTVWYPRSAWARPGVSAYPFTLGVASGSPTHDSIVLWTRLAARDAVLDRPMTVRFELAHDEAFTRIARRGQSLALPELGHAVHAEVQGLDADRWYFYRFFAGADVSPVGRTRTFPAPDSPAARLRLAYASCQRFDHGYFGAYRHMLHEQLDAVLFLGDYIYEYPGASQAVRTPGGGWVVTLADYRRRYALHRGEPELQAMHAACPWLVTWDDHEVQNDYAAGVQGEGGPPVADFGARRAAAYQAFYEHMPLPASALTRAMSGLMGGAEMRIYSQLRFGRLANICLLDDRQYRDPQVCTRNGKAGSDTVAVGDCAALHDPKRTLLGAAQEAWIARALGGGGDAWNIVAQQTLFGARTLSSEGEKTAVWNDGWDGYPAARSRVQDSLRRNQARKVVLLGGDVHENWVGHVKADYDDPGSASLGVEFCGTSITSRTAGAPSLGQRLAKNPHFVFADAQRKGYGVVEFTPGRLTTSLRVVSDVTQPAPDIETLARFTVAAGSARIERV